MKPKNHNCKCFKCKGDAYIYLNGAKRLMVNCVTCGFNTYLKNAAMKKSKICQITQKKKKHINVHTANAI